MSRANINWSSLKAFLISKGGALQYDMNGDHYDIRFYDGPEAITCVIYTGAVPDGVVANGYTQSQNDLDKNDFEANYKSAANGALSKLSKTTDEGLPVIAYSALGFASHRTRFHGYRYVAPGGITSIFDEKVTTQIFIQGGHASISGIFDGDYVSFSVVDKDNVLGLFSTYGLTLGKDVLEVDKYVYNIYLTPPQDVVENRVDVAGRVVAGLYFRITYTATLDIGNRIIRPTYLWFES